MKQSILILFIISGLLLFGCSSDNDNGGGIPASGSITMKLDGSDWQASGANGIRQNVGSNTQISVGGSFVRNLQANEFDTVTISFLSTSDITTGDYTGQDSLPYVQVTFNMGTMDPQDTFVSKIADATITSISDTNIQGTFSATLELQGESDIVITDGGFNVNIMN